MDDNVMRVLQMLQEGRITAQEAETLIAALRGEKAAPAEPEQQEPEEKQKGGFFFGFENIKAPKIDLDDFGERISKAVSKVQPEKILKRVQTQIRAAGQTGAAWSATVSARVKTWADGDDSRPVNTSGQAEMQEEHVQEVHLHPGAQIMIENPLGDVVVTGSDQTSATITARKWVLGPTTESLRAIADQIEIAVHSTDTRLDIRVSAPDAFRSGTVDLELRVPKAVQARVSTRFGRVEITGVEGRTEAVSTSGVIKLASIGADARCEAASGAIEVSDVAGSATVASQSGNISARSIKRGLSANSASGDVSASGIEGGRVECKSVSGDVSIDRLGLENPVEITVESISGSVNLTDASGSVGLKSVSGDVNADRLSTERIQANSVSGDINVALSNAFSGSAQLNSVSGDVQFALPAGSNARITMSTTSGDVECALDGAAGTVTDTLWTGQIGTGAGTINIQTLSGDAHVKYV